MENSHEEQYIQWCESPRIEVAVVDSGTRGASRFFPRDLLTRRSRRLRQVLQQQPDQVIELEGITTRTVKHFFIWSHSLHPSISHDVTFDNAAELGMLASRFQIPALSNQITDRIRSHIASDEWELQAAIVDQIYGVASSGSPLREVIRAALGKLPRSIVEPRNDHEEWRATVRKHSELGFDFFGALSAPWSADAYLSGVCRFHDHTNVLDQKSNELCDGCPYADEDCYPLSVPEQPRTTVSNDVKSQKKTAKLSSGDAVHNVVPKPKEGFVDESPPALVRQRVGNCIMITTDDFFDPKVNGLGAIAEGAVETNGGRPSLLKNGTMDSDDAIDDANEPITSEDQADEFHNARTIGTMTEVLNGEVDGSGEKADDEAPKMMRSKSKNKKKKRGPSFSVGTI
ncbi:uncharacterized protein AB675_5145 [Cyphellophora attinorum]|uniref:BTB domain-containing protein n=1 Tax=Cyphellophora attinorum TaxID=1664694 RepID=A0A0N1HA24_9EURO|nr:uncharacterized protein AB675_5145 [Phialophora attinorum]KPI39262.1 hypothetical protein AB675_5145 [Phialophora attinorum]